MSTYLKEIKCRYCGYLQVPLNFCPNCGEKLAFITPLGLKDYDPIRIYVYSSENGHRWVRNFDNFTTAYGKCLKCGAYSDETEAKKECSGAVIL